MGAKTWMLVYGTGNIGDVLKAKPLLDRQATTAFAGKLFPGEHLVELADGDLSNTCPDDDEIFAACFDGVAVVAAKEFAIDHPSALPTTFIGACPGHDVYLHAMHSVVDWLAFAVWRDGVLQRSLSLSPDSGILENIGAPLPFETPYWEGAHPTVELGDEDDAYPFVFHPLDLGEAALQAWFGYQLEGDSDPDQVPVFDIPLMRFKRKQSWWKFK